MRDYELPSDAQGDPRKRVSDWMPDPVAPYCSMRIIEGTDPTQVENRVAFIEKSPRVRFRLASPDQQFEDWKNWHYSGWKGDGGWDSDSQGWCDALLQQMGYEVPDPRPYPEWLK